jgi:hypothetical protein
MFLARFKLINPSLFLLDHLDNLRDIYIFIKFVILLSQLEMFQFLLILNEKVIQLFVLQCNSFNVVFEPIYHPNLSLRLYLYRFKLLL